MINEQTTAQNATLAAKESLRADGYLEYDPRFGIPGQRVLDRANNWHNYQPQNDPIARIEAKLDSILTAIGELRTQISSR